MTFKPRANRTVEPPTGPAIFRMLDHAVRIGHRPHYGTPWPSAPLCPGYEYALVADFQRQFAGVLCLQTGDETSASTNRFIYQLLGHAARTSKRVPARHDRFAE